MTFIANPLGSLGHNPQSLGNLTSGLEFLQKTEMQRRLNEINQNKEWERDDRIRNEKLALEMSSVPTANFVTQFEMNKFAKGKDEYTNYLTDLMQQKKGNLKTEDWIKLSQKKNALVDQTMRGKAFRDSFDKYQSDVISIKSKLKDREQIDDFNEKQAIFAKKIADPNYEPNQYDVIEALQVPEPSFRITLAETAKELLPFVDSAVVDAGSGRTAVDRNKLMNVIRNKVSDKDYLYSKGTEEGKVKTIDELYNKIADYIEPSIKTNVTPWKPDQTPESEKLSGFEGLYQSSVKEGERSPAYVFDKNKYKMKASLTTPEGKTTNADMTPLAIKENGMVEGEFTVDRNVTSPPLEYGQAMSLQVQTGGKLLPADKDGKIAVMYSQPTQYVQEVKASPDMIQKIKRADPSAAKYIEDKVDPYPERTAAEKAGAAKKQTKTVKPKTDPLGLF